MVEAASSVRPVCRSKLEERIDAVNQTLQKQGLTLNSYPLGGFRLGAPNEGKLEQLELLPFWSEALLEPEREQEAPPQESTPASPIVVTFYSFRGSVGRSTALAITAGLLARLNYRVVIVDLDLEAPGLSFLLIGDAQSDEATLRDGVLEFVYQRSLTAQTKTPDLNDCVVPLIYIKDRAAGRFS